MHPGKVSYIFNKDPGVTGNLEIKLKKKGASNEVIVHTKRGGQGYPSSNWSAFHTRLEKAMSA